MQDNSFSLKTPLYESHVENNARIVDFAGWLLPVQFSSIIAEHLHTRTQNTVFDICHMGEIMIQGDSASEDLDRLLTCRVSHLTDGKCSYCFILNENGCFIDDAILYRYSGSKYMLVVNAGRTLTDYEWILSHSSPGTEVINISADTAKIDLQGPLSIDTAGSLFPDFDFKALKRFSFSIFNWKNSEITVSATGYTGESGFEFFLPADKAVDFWKKLLKHETVLPAGLGARDSLRLEKRYSLYGHELTEKINPFEANLSRFITLEKDFIGKEALTAASEKGIKRLLVPFLCEGRRTARDGFSVYSGENLIGTVTSGSYSPVLKKSIGMCLVDINYTSVKTKIICRHDDIKINAEILN